MLVRQSQNSFIRIYDGGQLGYITNQLTVQDRLYDAAGADFLSQLSRKPQRVEAIADNLCRLYAGAYRNVILKDFRSFAEDLCSHHFVVMGETPEELDAQDPLFSYSTGNSKTSTEDFTQTTNETVDYSTQDFLLRHDRDTPRLACLQIELTGRCNERCIHCYIPNAKKNEGVDLSFDKFQSVIDQYSAMGGLQITLSGGEALMNKKIVRMLEYCRQKDLKISLLSNLTLLDDSVVQTLKKVNVSMVQTSLYSMNAAIHDSITKAKGSLQKTRDAIEKLRASDVPVLISCPVMKANRKEYMKVMEYAASLDLKAQTDYIMMAESNFDTGNLANRISIEETEELLRDLTGSEGEIERGSDSECRQSQPGLSEEEYAEMPMCGAGINDLSMTANGDVYPCSGWQSLIVGNVFRQPLKEIWEQSPQLAVIRKVRHRDFPKCMECKARDFCSMCLVRNFNENNGDMFKTSEHFCKVAFLTKRLCEEKMK